jgi:hypothetical protein
MAVCIKIYVKIKLREDILLIRVSEEHVHNHDEYSNFKLLETTLGPQTENPVEKWL